MGAAADIGRNAALTRTESLNTEVILLLLLPETSSFFVVKRPNGFGAALLLFLLVLLLPNPANLNVGFALFVDELVNEILANGLFAIFSSFFIAATAAADCIFTLSRLFCLLFATCIILLLGSAAGNDN